MDEQTKSTYERLKQIRVRTDLKVKPSKYLKTTFTGFDGVERPLTLRDYQIKGVLHLAAMPRFLLGDDTGLGKSLTSISALTYLWAADPNLKVIVLTTKSAIDQWRDEFTKFTTGIQTVTVSGTKAERDAAYARFMTLTGPSVLIMGYRAAVNDFSTLQHWQGYAMVTDECFSYHTPVLLADGTTELIGKIVSKKMPVEVLSWNEATGQVEPKKVVNWFRNALVKGRRKDIQKVTFDFSDSVMATESHKFYTPTVKKSLTDLKVGDETFHLSHRIPTEDQKQIVLGSLLGDASLSFPERPLVGVSFGHATAQRDLLKFKYDALASLGVGEIEDIEDNSGYAKKDGSPKGYSRFRLQGNPALSRIFKDSKVYEQGKKKVTVAWLSHVSALGLAIWFADDGSVISHTRADGTETHVIRLHTSGFSPEEQELLVGMLLWKFGITAEVKWDKPRTDRPNGNRKAHPHIYLKAEEAAKFFKVLPGAIPGVAYKFPPEMPLLSLSDIETQPTTGLVRDKIKSKQKRGLSGRESYVYDIEVEDNHNYFANGSLVSNCTAYKNPTTQCHKVILWMSKKSSRVWGLTATMIKNNLMEGYGIYSVLVPGLFPAAKNKFMIEYCVVKMQSIGKGRMVPIIVGYRKDDIAKFREMIDPYFLGRPKHEVSTELPTLTLRDIKVSITPKQLAKYGEATDGLLDLIKEGEEEQRETTKLTALIYCQQIVNDLALIGYPDEESPKLDALAELLEEDLEGEKVIVFTRFKKMVDIAVPYLKGKGIQCVRITGDEEASERRDAAKAFQDPNSKVRVCFITMAGSEAVNLQAAKALIFFDSPWSAGDYLQILGRMIRIGSLHDKVYAIHLITQGTIDGYVAQVIRRKMQLIEAVLGKRLKGEGDGTTPSDGQEVIQNTNEVNELFDTMVKDVQGKKGGRK